MKRSARMEQLAIWSQIQRDFIETGEKYPVLAEKYNVPLSTLKKKAAKYKWAEKRRTGEILEPEPEPQEEPQEEVPTVPAVVEKPKHAEIKIVDKRNDKERHTQLVDDMMDRIEEAICNVDPNDAASIKLLTGALKDLRLNRTELDIEEQKARIAKLKSDTRIVETEESGGVVFMPVMDARPVPPEDKQ